MRWKQPLRTPAVRHAASDPRILMTSTKTSDVPGVVSDAIVSGLFVVRLYDGFDYCWMDVSEPVSRNEAERIWKEKTDDGKRNTKYDDIDYYAIFPADTRMLFASR